MKRSQRILLSFATLLPLAALAVTSCGKTKAPSLVALGLTCTLNSDCDSPYVCAFKTCHEQCTSTRDCPTDQTCVESDRPNYVCQSPILCSLNSQCPGTEICAVDQQCRDACMTSRDCVVGQECVSGTCADPAQVIDGSLPSKDGSTSTGVPCTYSSQCPGTLVCLGAGVCGVECVTDKDCVNGYSCYESRCVPPGFDAGLASDSGTDSGIASASDANVYDGPTLDAGALTMNPTPSTDSPSGGVFANGLFYMISGTGFGSSAVAPMYAYDPATGQWTEPTTTLDDQVAAASRIVTDGAKLYLSFGAWSPDGSSYSTKIRQFDIATSTWSDLADCSSTNPNDYVQNDAGDMGPYVGRQSGVSAYYNNKLYYYSGLSSADPSPEVNNQGVGANYYSLGSVVIYDITAAKWSRSLSPINEPDPEIGFPGGGVVVGSKWYIIGGHRYQDGHLSPNLYSYDFASDTFTELAPGILTNDTSSTQAGIAANGTTLHIINNGKYVTYDIGTGTITPKPDLPAYATFATSAAAIYENSLYILDLGSTRSLVRVDLE